MVKEIARKVVKQINLLVLSAKVKIKIVPVLCELFECDECKKHIDEFIPLIFKDLDVCD